MSTFVTDFGGECLVTDLVNELSSGLEIQFLLQGATSACEKGVKYNEDLFDKEKHDYFTMDPDDSFTSNCDHVKNEPVSDTDDSLTCLIENERIVSSSKTNCFGKEDRNDHSPIELYPLINHLETPPVTPPEEKTYENYIFLNSKVNPNVSVCPNNVQIEISQKGLRKSKQSFNGLTLPIIQPKSQILVFDNTADNQQLGNRSNLFKGFNKVIKTEVNSSNERIRNVSDLSQSRKESEILKAKKRQERMIRNRESAFLSRKRKKDYVTDLEKRILELVSKNDQLRQENYILKERLKKHEDVESFNIGSKTGNIFMDSPRKTTALLALMLTVCINIGSFSNFLNERIGRQSDENLILRDKIIYPAINNRHSRSLLWSESQIDDLKSSFANLSVTSCPVNQTESIRLESELRKWIGGEEDVPRNISKIHQFFYTPDLIFKSQRDKSLKSKRKRIHKMHFPQDVEVDVFRMKSNFFNYDPFFEAIHRRDDTFYLVSFSADHLLLPALAHNKTSRPKLSLMLPTFSSNTSLGISSDQVELMQIDCEVTNTQLLSVNESDIPSRMKPYHNSTSRQKNSKTEDNSQFSQYLYKDIIDNKSLEQNFNVSLDKKRKNYSKSGGFGSLNGTFSQNVRTEEKNVKIMSFHNYISSKPDMTEKQHEFKLRNNYQESFINKRSRNNSRDVVDVSDSEVGDTLQLMNSNSKNIVKKISSILPSNKQFNYLKKPYLKNFRNAIKFIFP